MAVKIAAPDCTWTFTETGVNGGSFKVFDDGHETQRIMTGTRAYFDKHGGTVLSFQCDALHETNLLAVNKRITKAVTTLTKKVVVTVLFDADTHVANNSPDNDSRGGSLPPHPPAPPATNAPSPGVVVAAALAAQGSGYRSRRIDQFFIPHGSARSTSSARTIVRLRARGDEPPVASGSGLSSSAPRHEDVHGPRPRPLHVLSDDEEARRPSKKRKRNAPADSDFSNDSF